MGSKSFKSIDNATKSSPFELLFVVSCYYDKPDLSTKAHTGFPGNTITPPPDVECTLPKEDPARLIDDSVNNVTYEEVYGTDALPGRNPIYPDTLLLKVCLMAATLTQSSTRNNEDLCRFDLHFPWLLQGFRRPDHTTIARFKRRIAPQLLLRCLAGDLHNRGLLWEDLSRL